MEQAGGILDEACRQPRSRKKPGTRVAGRGPRLTAEARRGEARQATSGGGPGAGSRRVGSRTEDGGEARGVLY